MTPLYDSLRTNIPLPVMTFPNFPFPPETPLFPPASAVHQYLEDYAAHFDLLRYVRLFTRVEKIFWDMDSGEWDVALSTGEGLRFDFVVVANGHFRKPRYPDTAGLQSWLHSGRATHSAWFRYPNEFAHHRKVMLVGGGPSALDICTEMIGVVPLLLHSIPGPKPNGALTYLDDTGRYRKVPRVAEYRGDRSILFVDGATESDIDLVILATGYEVSFPFLSQMNLEIPSLPPPLPSELYNSTYHVFPLAYELFPLQGVFPPTSIAFPGLLHSAAPFRVFEAQAGAIARVLEIPESLEIPSCATDIVSRVHEIMHEEGTNDPLRIAKRWCRLVHMEPFRYLDRLWAFSGESGTIPDWEIECWENRHAIRMAWTSIEQSGEGKELLQGVGTNGLEDWVGLCLKLINESEPKL